MSDNVFHATDTTGDIVGDFGVAALTWPQLPAILHNGTAMTYQELAQRVSSTAAGYRARGYGADGRAQLVGALVSPAPAVVEHLLAILQAGAAYCPIDAALPEARKQALAAALGLDCLFAVAPNPRGPANLRLDSIDNDTEATQTDVPRPAGRPDDPAYVLCTSGSTGMPKPVVISRRALTVGVRALRDLFGLTPGDRVLQFASLSWDTCLEEMLPALTAGATVVFDDAARAGSMPRFVRMLAERELTVLDLPTAFWHELVLYLDEERAALPDSVRIVVIGGERVDPTRLRQWRNLDAVRNVGHVVLLNTYGCTETTMVTHSVQLSGPGTERDVVADEVAAPLGRPLPHVRDHVTDEGELLVSGPSLATGYLGLPEASAAGFPIADHGDGPTRWFHTGDLVARDENGLVHPLGRADEQVKVLGVRVHPAEVEAHLNSHPAVAGAVVVGERLLGRTSLTAYVAPASTISPAELKSHLRERLPSQFVPSQVKFVEALAYTPTGKVDRMAMRRASADQETGGPAR